MTKFDIYETITNTIIEQLEAGNLPWLRPWKDKDKHKGTNALYPFNGATGRNYNGLNVLLLGCNKYASRAWYSYKQVSELGGNVRKGEKSSMVTYWSINEKKDDDGNIKKTFFLKYYNLFNYEQCDNLPTPKQIASKPISYTSLDAIVKDTMGLTLGHGGNRAFYSPSMDAIQMPYHEAFASPAHYSATLLHELTHATGHEKRCNRDFSGRFGSDAYAFEELVAELGSAFLGASLDVEPLLQHNASYIQGWLKVLKDDKRAIVTASSKAQQAAKYVLDAIGATDSEAIEEPLAA